MNARQLRNIVIGLVVLLALWGASEYFARAPDTTTGRLHFAPLTATAVDSVIIIHRNDTTLIAKQASGSWTVNRFPASSTAVADLFTAFADSNPELAAQSASSFERMGVDSAAGRMVRVAGGGKTLAQVLVGSRGPSFDAAYVRVAGDTRVYLWRGALPNVAERTVDDWREKQIAAVPPESIAAVEVLRGGKRYSLRKEKTGWAFAAPSRSTVDTAAVTRYLELFRRITASGFASQHEADSLRARGKPVRRITVRAASGRELLALALDTATVGFWTRRAGDPTTYRLEFWQADQLAPAEQTLAKK